MANSYDRDHRNGNFVLTMAILIMLVAMTFYTNVIASDAQAQTVTGSGKTSTAAKVKCGQAGASGSNVDCDSSADTGANAINNDTLNSPNNSTGANTGADAHNGTTLNNSTLGTTGSVNAGASVNTANPGAGSLGAAGGLGGGAHLR
jgi:hypothetical protein